VTAALEKTVSSWRGGMPIFSDFIPWMLFVDGENFTIRAQAIPKREGSSIKIDIFLQSFTPPVTNPPFFCTIFITKGIPLLV